MYSKLPTNDVLLFTNILRAYYIKILILHSL